MGLTVCVHSPGCVFAYVGVGALKSRYRPRSCTRLPNRAHSPPSVFPPHSGRVTVNRFTLLVEGAVDTPLPLPSRRSVDIDVPLSETNGRVGLTANSTDLVLQEPAVNGTRVTLHLQRAGGVFGGAEVVWRVTALAGGTVTDVVPSSGRVGLEDGQAAAVIELSVVADAEPELDEAFRCVCVLGRKKGEGERGYGTLPCWEGSAQSRQHALTMCPPPGVWPQSGARGGRGHWHASRTRGSFSQSKAGRQR